MTTTKFPCVPSARKRAARCIWIANFAAMWLAVHGVCPAGQGGCPAGQEAFLAGTGTGAEAGAEAGAEQAGEKQPAVSRLWGKQGELWSPQSRLPDFSFAGYRWGQEKYRIPRESISVKDFGAAGDGKTDDTAAFQRAIAAGRGKLILIPAGRYILNGLLKIDSSNTVLRGDGSSRTTLVFQTPGDKLDPRPAKTDGNQPTTNWSWAGGLISIGGPAPRSQAAAKVRAPASRGATELVLESAPFQPGEEVLLVLSDDESKSLLEYLYRGQTGDISGLNRWRVMQVFRITQVKGNTIFLNRPLRFDVRPQWRPTLERFRPAVTDAGIEGICFDFPVMRYEGHFREVGYNPVEITRWAAHCWLRDLLIRNADSGPYVSGFFCTVEDIRLEADPQRLSPQGYSGHHGISLYGNDCLCQDFSIQTRFIHDLTVQSAIGCVFSRGKAIDLNMDHHRWAPYENLFTDIDAGKGTRLFASSGGGMRGNHSAAGATFWNIRAQRAAAWPKWGVDAINIVAVPIIAADKPAGPLPEPTASQGRWLEPIEPGKIEPANLYEAMKARRSRR